MKKREVIITAVQLILTTMLFMFGEFAPVTVKLATGAFIAGYAIQTSSLIYYCILELKNKNFINTYFITIIATSTLMALGLYKQALMALIVFSFISQEVRYLNSGKKMRAKSVDKLLPKSGGIFINGIETKKGVEELRAGNIVIVKEGEIIPGDGRVFTGSAYIDLEPLKGHKEIKQVYKGDIVLAGSINRRGILQVELIGEPQNSLICRMVKKAKEAEGSKGHLEMRLKKIFKILKPILLISAIAVSCATPFFLGYDYTPWLIRGTFILFFASLDTVVQFIHLSISLLIYDLYFEGIIPKDAEAMEEFANVEAIIIDKNLSVEERGYVVTRIENINRSKEELITLAAYLEHFSKHPVANAIVNAFLELAKYEGVLDKNPIKPHMVSKVEIVPRKGVAGYVGEHFVCVGNDAFIKSLGIEGATKDKSHKRVHIAIEREYCGYIELEYKSKEEEDIYSTWRKAGIKKCALGGDNFYEVIEELKASGCTKDKIAFIGEEDLQEEQYRKVGSHIALNSFNKGMSSRYADIFVMNDSFNSIAEIKIRSKKGLRKIKQKALIAVVTKIVVFGGSIAVGAPLYGAIAIDGIVNILIGTDIRKEQGK